jgi:predicted PurR-regulated permease PerM
MIIIIVIAGQSVWGIVGMVIAIPLAGMTKVLFDAIPITKPLGYLLGNEDISNGGLFQKIEERIKAWFK